MSDHSVKTQADTTVPRSILRIRTFDVCGVSIPLPWNKVMYSASEVCSILVKNEQKKSGIKHFSLTDVIQTMIKYKARQDDPISPLIPCSLPAMFRVLTKFKANPDIEWPQKGRPPILSNKTFMKSARDFEKDEGRGISKTDMDYLLTSAKKMRLERQVIRQWLLSHRQFVPETTTFPYFRNYIQSDLYVKMYRKKVKFATLPKEAIVIVEVIS